MTAKRFADLLAKHEIATYSNDERYDGSKLDLRGLLKDLLKEPNPPTKSKAPKESDAMPQTQPTDTYMSEKERIVAQLQIPKPSILPLLRPPNNPNPKPSYTIPPTQTSNKEI